MTNLLFITTLFCLTLNGFAQKLDAPLIPQRFLKTDTVKPTQQKKDEGNWASVGVKVCLSAPITTELGVTLKFCHGDDRSIAFLFQYLHHSYDLKVSFSQNFAMGFDASFGASSFLSARLRNSVLWDFHSVNYGLAPEIGLDTFIGSIYFGHIFYPINPMRLEGGFTFSLAIYIPLPLLRDY